MADGNRVAPDGALTGLDGRGVTTDIAGPVGFTPFAPGGEDAVDGACAHVARGNGSDTGAARLAAMLGFDDHTDPVREAFATSGGAIGPVLSFFRVITAINGAILCVACITVTFSVRAVVVGAVTEYTAGLPCDAAATDLAASCCRPFAVEAIDDAFVANAGAGLFFGRAGNAVRTGMGGDVAPAGLGASTASGGAAFPNFPIAHVAVDLASGQGANLGISQYIVAGAGAVTTSCLFNDEAHAGVLDDFACGYASRAA